MAGLPTPLPTPPVAIHQQQLWAPPQLQWVNAAYDGGRTALYWVAAVNNVEAAQLLTRGANRDAHLNMSGRRYRPAGGGRATHTEAEAGPPLAGTAAAAGAAV